MSLKVDLSFTTLSSILIAFKCPFLIACSNVPKYSNSKPKSWALHFYVYT